MLPVAVARSSTDVMCFRFVDDVIFSYNAGNMPESQTMRMFRTVRQVAPPGKKSALSVRILFNKW